MVGAGGFEPPASWSQTMRSDQAELRPEDRLNSTRVPCLRSTHPRPAIADDAEIDLLQGTLPRYAVYHIWVLRGQPFEPTPDPLDPILLVLAQMGAHLLDPAQMTADHHQVFAEGHYLSLGYAEVSEKPAVQVIVVVPFGDRRVELAEHVVAPSTDEVATGGADSSVPTANSIETSGSTMRDSTTECAAWSWWGLKGMLAPYHILNDDYVKQVLMKAHHSGRPSVQVLASRRNQSATSMPS